MGQSVLMKKHEDWAGSVKWWGLGRPAQRQISEERTLELMVSVCPHDHEWQCGGE
jgi:hypothetical protein